MKQISSWRPFTANCCSTDDQIILRNISRCKPSCSDLSKDVAPLPSFKRLSFSDPSHSSSKMINEDDPAVVSSGPDLHDFQLSELRAITQNSSFLVDEGGFGTVHKGYVDDNLRQGLKAQPVAVKLLDNERLQGHHEWLAEVIFLGQLKHPNLVKLIGYCCEDKKRLLVYEFMPRGSLENHLFGRQTSLPWGTRLKIAIGAAKGLSFLHESEKPITYRDFKTSSFLLDYDFTAKLSDFELVKMGPEGSNTHISTKVMSTYGYAAPEYISSGRLTIKSDVYSFGVVLLELLTGRRAMDKTRPKTEQNLVDWSKPYLSSSRRLSYIMDPRLAGQYSYSVKGAKEMAILALQCVSLNPKDRPRMPTVVETLESLKQQCKDIAVTSGYWLASRTFIRNGASKKEKTKASANQRKPSSSSEQKNLIPTDWKSPFGFQM